MKLIFDEPLMMVIEKVSIITMYLQMLKNNKLPEMMG